MTAASNAYTPDRCIREAMQNCGKLQSGDDPSSEDFANYMPRLNSIFNYLQTKGLKLWLNYDKTIPLVAGTALYTLGPAGTVVMTKPLRVILAYYLDLTGNQYPLTAMSWSDYKQLSNLNQQGSLNSYFVDKQQLSLNVYFWLVPDAFTASNGSAHLVIQQQITGLVSLTDTMNFPVEWFLALTWTLAHEISTGQPQSVQAKCAALSKQYVEDLENWDVEDVSTTFTPDPRMNTYMSSFR